MPETSKQIQDTRQGGFILIELLVVTGILSVLLSLTLTSINPTKQFEDARNTQRQSNAVAILDAIYEYESDNGGKEPTSVAGVTSTPEPLAEKVVGAINICPDLVPNYLVDLPIDPSIGTVTGTKLPCDPATTAYNTGYTISQSSEGRFTISATGEDGVGTIRVNR